MPAADRKSEIKKVSAQLTKLRAEFLRKFGDLSRRQAKLLKEVSERHSREQAAAISKDIKKRKAAK